MTAAGFLIFTVFHVIHKDAELQALKTICTGNALGDKR